MSGGVPIVVANQYKVLDQSATFFAQQFYWSLAQGMTVGEAAREARVAVNYSLAGESIDWAVPVVYARDPNARLAPSQRSDRRAMPSAAVRMSDRQGIARHKVRVAVWDASSQFPDLKATLERMNAVQSYYGFEIVDLTVPLDAWHMKDGTRYLDANRFADRLAPLISQLGVHYISAIVNERMACDVATGRPIYDIYAWWPPVVIFSSRGLGLEPRGQATHRVIANVTVAGIAGYLMDELDAHKEPRSCPNFYNPSKDLTILTDRQKFCSHCSRELNQLRRADERKALNAILLAF
jgi:hypothetical protein